MSLYDTIQNDLKESLKKKDSVRTSTLRMLKSALQYATMDNKIEIPDDATIINTLRKQVKQRKDSIESYEKGGRPDLKELEEKELLILEAYLPTQISDEALDKIIKNAILDTGATSKKEMGLVIKATMEKTCGQADGKKISQRVSQLLQ
jgi:uncharacterized protein YqeY